MNTFASFSTVFIATLLTAMLSSRSVAQTLQPPSQSSQVKQVVEAVSGHWVGQMTAALPGLRPEPFPWEMVCNSAALGAGASCSMKGAASIGGIEEACLLAYDPDGKAIHFYVRHVDG